MGLVSVIPVRRWGEILKERDFLKQLGPVVSDSEVRAHWPLRSSRYMSGFTTYVTKAT